MAAEACFNAFINYIGEIADIHLI